MRILIILVFFTLKIFAQADNPWTTSAGVPWAGNPANSTQFRWADYFPSATAGAYYLGGFAQATITSGVTISADARCDNSPQRDIWFVIPPHPSGAGNVIVKPTLINYTTSDPIPARYVVYKGTSCTGSGACSLTYITSYCNASLDTEGSCTAGVGGMYNGTHTISVVAGESIYVQMWADDNDGDMSGSVYALYNSSSYSAPSNDACSSPIYISSTNGASWSGNNFGASGSGDISPPNACGWNVSDQTVYYYFQATASSVSLTFNGVSCMFTSCPGAPSSDLQVAVYDPNSTTITSACSPGTYRTCSNNTGNFTINLSSLVAGRRYIIAIDALSGKICSWSGISMTNISVLSVELRNFKVIKDDDSVLLNWVTASEKNHARFEIEKSIDGINFIKIGELNSKGESYRNNEYYFRDPAYLKGIMYYRLKQVDKDGSFEYSQLQSINLGSKFIKIHPNPSDESNKLHISLSESDYLSSSVEVFDQFGICIFNLTKINDLEFDINTQEWAKGVYYIRFISNQPTLVKQWIKL